MIRTIAALVVATACLVMGTALSQEKSPDGTVHLREGSVAVGIGFAWGGGTLNYKGQNYPLKIRGLSIGEAGVSKAPRSQCGPSGGRAQWASLPVSIIGDPDAGRKSFPDGLTNRGSPARAAES